MNEPFTTASLKETKKIEWVSILFIMGLLFVFIVFAISNRAESFIGVFVALSFFFTLLRTKRETLLYMLYLVTALFFLGYRTMSIGEYVKISPPEAIILYLYFIIIFLRIRPQYGLRKWFLLAGWLFIVFVLIGLLTAARCERNMSLAFSYANLLVFSLPIFYVIHCLVENVATIRKILFLFVVTAALTSSLGIIEYFGIEIPFLKGYLSFETLDIGADFARAKANFWGGPILAAYLVLIFPLMVSFFYIFKKSIYFRLLIIVSSLTCISFIIFSGYRGIWLAFVIMVAVYTFYRGKQGISLIILTGLLAYYFAFPLLKYRIQALDESHPAIAASVIERHKRFSDAVAIARESPFEGIGWGGSGLVHSDIVQFAADAGMFTSIFFILFYLKVLNQLRKSIKDTQDPELKEYKVAILSSLAGFFFSFFVESYLNLPELFIPFWFILGMAWLLAKFKSEDEIHRQKI